MNEDALLRHVAELNRKREENIRRRAEMLQQREAEALEKEREREREREGREREEKNNEERERQRQRQKQRQDRLEKRRYSVEDWTPPAQPGVKREEVGESGEDGDEEWDDERAVEQSRFPHHLKSASPSSSRRVHTQGGSGERGGVKSMGNDILPFLEDFEFKPAAPSSHADHHQFLPPSLMETGVGGWEEVEEELEGSDDMAGVSLTHTRARGDSSTPLQFREPLELGEEDVRLEAEIEQYVEDERPSPRALAAAYRRERRAKLLKAKREEEEFRSKMERVQADLDNAKDAADRYLHEREAGDEGRVAGAMQRRNIGGGYQKSDVHHANMSKKVANELMRRDYRSDDNLLNAEAATLTPRSLKRRIYLQRKQAKERRERLQQLHAKVNMIRQRKHEGFLYVKERGAGGEEGEEGEEERRIMREVRREERKERAYVRYGMYLQPYAQLRPKRPRPRRDASPGVRGGAGTDNDAEEWKGGGRAATQRTSTSNQNEARWYEGESKWGRGQRGGRSGSTTARQLLHGGEVGRGVSTGRSGEPAVTARASSGTSEERKGRPTRSGGGGGGGGGGGFSDRHLNGTGGGEQKQAWTKAATPPLVPEGGSTKEERGGRRNSGEKGRGGKQENGSSRPPSVESKPYPPAASTRMLAAAYAPSTSTTSRRLREPSPPTQPRTSEGSGGAVARPHQRQTRPAASSAASVWTPSQEGGGMTEVKKDTERGRKGGSGGVGGGTSGSGSISTSAAKPSVGSSMESGNDILAALPPHLRDGAGPNWAQPSLPPTSTLVGRSSENGRGKMGERKEGGEGALPSRGGGAYRNFGKGGYGSGSEGGEAAATQVDTGTSSMVSRLRGLRQMLAALET